MHQIARYSEGKTTYRVEKGVYFQNTSRNQLDGLQKAQSYCFEHDIPEQNIIRFDSELEMKRYEYLLEQCKSGKISKLFHHRLITLQDGFVNANGDDIPPIIYNADFAYYDNESNHFIIEDVKGSSFFTDTRFELMKQVADKILLPKNTYLRIIRWESVDVEGQEKPVWQWVEWHLGEKKKKGRARAKQSAKIKMLEEQKKVQERQNREILREQAKKEKAEQHAKEIAENKRQREIDRLHELRDMPKRTKAQQIRLEQLEAKYSV